MAFSAVVIDAGVSRLGAPLISVDRDLLFSAFGIGCVVVYFAYGKRELHFKLNVGCVASRFLQNLSRILTVFRFGILNELQHLGRWYLATESRIRPLPPYSVSTNITIFRQLDVN